MQRDAHAAESTFHCLNKHDECIIRECGLANVSLRFPRYFSTRWRRIFTAGFLGGLVGIAGISSIARSSTKTVRRLVRRNNGFEILYY